MTTLIGTNPDQIPVNSMLGGMAYQDPDSINVKDFNSSGTANIASLVSPAVSVTTLTNTTANITTANITNVSYTGTLTGGIGVINIGSNQIYKDASGNVGLGAVPISNGKTLTLVNTTTNPSSFYLQNSTTGFTTTDGTLLQLSGSASYLWNFENSTLSLATNNTEYVKLTSTGDLLNLGTGATKLQEGTTAQRPASPQEGMIRKNSTLGFPEVYSNSQWRGIVLNTDTKVVRTTTSNVSLNGQTSGSVAISSSLNDPELTIKLFGVSLNGSQIPQIYLPENVLLTAASYQSLVTRISNTGVITTYATNVGADSATRIPLNTSATSATALLYGTVKVQYHGSSGYYSGVLYSVDGATTATITISGTFTQAAGINAVGISANGGTFDAGSLGLVYTYSE